MRQHDVEEAADRAGNERLAATELLVDHLHAVKQTSLFDPLEGVQVKAVLVP